MKTSLLERAFAITAFILSRLRHVLRASILTVLDWLSRSRPVHLVTIWITTFITKVLPNRVIRYIETYWNWTVQVNQCSIILLSVSDSFTVFHRWHQNRVTFMARYLGFSTELVLILERVNFYFFHGFSLFFCVKRSRCLRKQENQFFYKIKKNIKFNSLCVPELGFKKTGKHVFWEKIIFW